MSLRRTFLLGAAALAGVAALVAIAAVLSGDLGETEGKIFATLAATFVAGSALTSGVALLARRASPLVGYAGIVLALFGYVIWAEQIWVEHESDGYWKVLGTALIWTLALLLISTNRLMLSSPRLIGTLYPATAAAATLAAATSPPCYSATRRRAGSSSRSCSSWPSSARCWHRSSNAIRSPRTHRGSARSDVLPASRS